MSSPQELYETVYRARGAHVTEPEWSHYLGWIRKCVAGNKELRIVVEQAVKRCRLSGHEHIIVKRTPQCVPGNYLTAEDMDELLAMIEAAGLVVKVPA